MRKLTKSAAIVALMLLAACGAKRDLKPAVGQALPVAPYGRSDRPNAEQLLTVLPQAAPGRSVELRQRSEARTDDPFDLPPQ